MRTFILTLVLSMMSSLLLAFSVVSVLPSQNSMGVAIDASIIVTFDQPVDPESVHSSSIHAFGRWSGVADLSFSLADNNTLMTIVPQGDFFYGEYVMIGLSDGVSSETGDELSHGYGFGFWTAVLTGSMELSDMGHLEVREPGEGLIQCYGAYAGDVNEDGWSDLSVVNETSGDMRVFLSDEGLYSEFSLHSLPMGNKPSANEGTDFNGDGHIDLVIGNTQGNMMSIILGDGTGQFSPEVTYQAGQGVRGVTVLDLEGDGDMDVATANRQAGNITVFFNDGTANFSEGVNLSTPLSGETAIISADMNEDGWMDLVIGGYLSDELAVLQNDGSGNFSLVSQVSTGDGPWMITMGDVNGDGHVDIAAACSSANAITIHLGDGTGQLSSADFLPSGNFPLAIDLGDLDGDGDLDVISSNYNGGNFSLYENVGSGTFENLQTLDSEIAGSCAIFHDRNHDGRMDITGIDELADVLIFFENLPLSVLDSSPLSFSVFPNPGHGEFTVKNGSEMVLNLQLIDPMGRLTQEEKIPSWTSFHLAIKEGLVPGSYVLRDTNSTSSLQLIIE